MTLTKKQRQDWTVIASLIALAIGFLLPPAFPDSARLFGVLGGAGLAVLVMTVAEQSRARRAKMKQDTLAVDNKAVSPVIGVILMVAITVVLAVVVFVLVSNLGDGAVAYPPDFAVAHDGGGNYTVLRVEAGVPWSDLLLGCGAGNDPPTVTMNGEDVTAGDTMRCDAGSLSVVHRPTGSVIYRDT